MSARLNSMPSPSPSQGRELTQAMLAEVDPVVIAWIERDRPGDPVFSSPAEHKRLEKQLTRSIQTYLHSPAGFFPPYAAQCGLTRFVPTKDKNVIMGSRGTTCRAPFQASHCHDHAVPAFLYEHPKLLCSTAEKANAPTLIWRWRVTGLKPFKGRRAKPELQSKACWQCYTRGYKCPLLKVKLALAPSLLEGLAGAGGAQQEVQEDVDELDEVDEDDVGQGDDDEDDEAGGDHEDELGGESDGRDTRASSSEDDEGPAESPTKPAPRAAARTGKLHQAGKPAGKAHGQSVFTTAPLVIGGRATSKRSASRDPDVTVRPPAKKPAVKSKGGTRVEKTTTPPPSNSRSGRPHDVDRRALLSRSDNTGNEALPELPLLVGGPLKPADGARPGRRYHERIKEQRAADVDDDELANTPHPKNGAAKSSRQYPRGSVDLSVVQVNGGDTTLMSPLRNYTDRSDSAPGASSASNIANSRQAGSDIDIAGSIASIAEQLDSSSFAANIDALRKTCLDNANSMSAQFDLLKASLGTFVENGAVLAANAKCHADAMQLLRVERDTARGNLKSAETRLVSKDAVAQEARRIAAEAQNQVSFLEKKLQEATEQSAASDSRYIEAIDARDVAQNNVGILQAEVTRIRERLSRFESRNKTLSTEIREAQAALDDAYAEVDQTARQRDDLQREIERVNRTARRATTPANQQAGTVSSQGIDPASNSRPSTPVHGPHGRQGHNIPPVPPIPSVHRRPLDEPTAHQQIATPGIQLSAGDQSGPSPAVNRLPIPQTQVDNATLGPAQSPEAEAVGLHSSRTAPDLTRAEGGVSKETAGPPMIGDGTDHGATGPTSSSVSTSQSPLRCTPPFSAAEAAQPIPPPDKASPTLDPSLDSGAGEKPKAVTPPASSSGGNLAGPAAGRRSSGAVADPSLGRTVNSRSLALTASPSGSAGYATPIRSFNTSVPDPSTRHDAYLSVNGQAPSDISAGSPSVTARIENLGSDSGAITRGVASTGETLSMPGGLIQSSLSDAGRT